MSLFKIRQFWTTTSEDDEYFDQNSLHIAKINSEFDYVITGSQSGVLRIFSPNCDIGDNDNYSGFHPNDLIVEKIFDSPILQVSSGKLVSGNQTAHLALLHPKLISIYSLIIKTCKTEHGNQSYLQLLYEHKLRRSASSFIIGPFGGSQNRDFICVQSLDGLLSFYEQENQALHVNLPDFLLPGPLCYIVKTDTFVTTSPDWGVVAFRYKVLSEAADESTDPLYSKPKIFREWQYPLGECVIDIQAINDTVNKETWIAVLGEKNMFCLTSNGVLKFMKKLDYCPICMNTYVLDGNLFTIIVAETNMLLIYENTKLKWSAHVDFLPTAINRVFLKGIKGAVALLSDEGRLECCYLGTEPSFFVAPPLNLQEVDFVKAEQDLLALEKVISDSNNNDAAMQSNIEKELEMRVEVNGQIEVCTFEHNIKNATSNYMCEIKIELQPRVQLQEIQISIEILRPLKVVPDTHFFSNFYETTNVTSYVFLDEAQDVPSLLVEIKASVINRFGVPRTLSQTAMLPLTLILESCTPEKDGKHKITLAINQAAVSLSNLFPEYNDNISTSNAMGFKSASGNVGSILLAKSSEKYRLQTDTFTMLSVMVEQLISRLKRNFFGNTDFNILFNSSLPATDIFFYANNHFTLKQQVKELHINLSQLGSQFRLIQKRLVEKYRAKNPTSLKSLELLLNDTYSDIWEITERLENELELLSKAQTDLACALHLVRQLTEISKIDSELVDIIKSLFCPKVHDLEAQAWEDVMDASLCYLLRTSLAKTDKDTLRAPHTSFDEIKDLVKFEKHLSQVLERLPKQIASEPELSVENEDSEKAELQEGEKPEKPIGSQYGELSSRLLSARRNLMKRHTIINEIRDIDDLSEQ